MTDPRGSVRARIRAGHAPDARPDVLAQLAGDRENVVRCAVALNPAAPPEVLAQLAVTAGDCRPADAIVLKAVAENPSTPAGTLSVLAGHDNQQVRRAVAANASTPPGVLHTLAGDEHVMVRTAVAANPAAGPQTMLTALLRSAVAAQSRRQVAAQASDLADTLLAAVLASPTGG